MQESADIPPSHTPKPAKIPVRFAPDLRYNSPETGFFLTCHSKRLSGFGRFLSH
jgi:hypothetical protein